MDSPNPNPTSMRVLTRPPITAPSPSSDTQPSPSQLPSRSLDGVVVIGFISHNPDHSSQLINRVLDSNVFGSGHLYKPLFIDKEELKDWFSWRRISYYHDEEKGFLFLQLCSTWCPVVHGFSRSGLDPVLEEKEFDDLRGLLFLFSVCHVVLYIQEGLRFDPHILKKFRVLQAAKHGLAPYVRSRTIPPLPSRPHSSLSSCKPSPSTSSSPGKSGGIMTRNSSAISLMSDLGSYTSLFPGNCTPVLLFVFIDDIFDIPNLNSNNEEPKDVPSLNQSSSLGSASRPNLPAKGSGSVVVLARPINKSEGGFRKKLQSSLEAQIRFLIKKCRTLSGSESGHTGSRSGGVSSSAPLFSLDASRAVVLLDRSINEKGESLEFAIDLVEDVLNGKATSDSLLLENHPQSANKEDILSVKEFIHRQSEILRGRGGLVTGANSGPATGVGMVAAAAAAAAASASASAASGRTFTAPELPSLEVWLLTSQLILQGILSAKRGFIDEAEAVKRKSRQRNTGPVQAEGFGSRGMDSLDTAVSLLESGRGLNTKFSTLWCERTLPTAKDVYLKDLPACYPTSQHKAHLEKALQAFHSLVRGPVVPLYTKRLEDECTSIWKSGRQLCDAISLTGKPCMHQRHDSGNSELDSLVEAPSKPHSSGYVFLHACACGRSRQLRSDPFDFESANISSSCFKDCDKLLPAVQLPEQKNVGPVRSSSWSLIRVGGARYYERSRGLLQSGFSASQKYLLKWIIVLEKPVNPHKTIRQVSVIRQGTAPQVETVAMIDGKRTGSIMLNSEDMQAGVENQRKLTENSKIDDKRNSFGRGIPNFTMRKPFSEVVAGTSTNDSRFPPLQLRKQSPSGSERGVKPNRARDRTVEQVHTTVNQVSLKSEDTVSGQETFNRTSDNSGMHGDPFVQIGSNAVPVSITSGEMVKLNPTLKHGVVYVGFEHECPHGHRFLLSPNHLDELGSPNSLPEVSQFPSLEIADYNLEDSSNLGRNGIHGKTHRSSKGATFTAANKVRSLDKPKEIGLNNALCIDGLMQFSSGGKGYNHTFNSEQTRLEVDFHSINLDDGGSAFSMLNRNLPIYMNCPYCRCSKNKKDLQKTMQKNKFAGTISQLQRIFLVTPPFPIVLATCPVVQFEASCLPPSVVDREQKLQFSLGCRVVLPPESFLALRLPFVYGVQLGDGNPLPLNAFEYRPEMTAWIMKGTALQVISKGSSFNEETQT